MEGKNSCKSLIMSALQLLAKQSSAYCPNVYTVSSQHARGGIIHKSSQFLTTLLMAFVHNELSTPSRIRIYVATVYTTYCFYYLPLLPESSSTNEVSLLRGVGRMKCSGIIFEGACLIYAPTFFRKIFCNLHKPFFKEDLLVQI